LSISSTHQRFSVFLRGSQIFSREKTVAPARKNTNAATTKTPVPALKKHQCLHPKTPMPRPQKHQCLRPKTPMPRSQKPQCLRAKTPLPGHPMWPRPSAYTREFRKLTCVGTGPRPRRVCRQWGFCGRGIGVFWVQALVFLRSRHWCFCAGTGHTLCDHGER